MKKIILVSLLIFGSALSCDVSSTSDKEEDCLDFFSCNEGIFEGDGEEGGIIDRYVICMAAFRIIKTPRYGKL